MKKFTFGILCYNQQKYVIEHLESIKLLINKYGKDVVCSLVVSDDHSRDNTVSNIKLWVDKNRYLFDKVSIIANKKNLGIVKNYLQLVNAIEDRNFLNISWR